MARSTADRQRALPSPLPPQLGEGLEQGVDLPVGFAVLDRQGLHHPLREAGRPVGVGDGVLHPPDHGLLLYLRIGQDTPGEAQRIEDGEECGPGFPVSVVRGCRQEEPVLEVLGQAADGAGLVAVDGIGGLGSLGGDVVSFVDDQEVKGAGVGRPLG